MFRKTINSLEKHVPTIDRDSIAFFREEKDGVYSILSNCGYTSEMILNKTGKEIMDLCCDNRSIAEIISAVSKVYTNVKEDIIKNDTLNLLYNFNRIQIIQWKDGESPFMFNNSYDIPDGTVSMATEKDIRTISAFMRKGTRHQKPFYTLINYTRSEESYCDEVFIRYTLFDCVEDYFIVKDNQKEVVGVISVIPPKDERVSCQFGIVSCNPQFASDAINVIVQNYPQIASDVIKCEKFKIQLLKSQISDKTIDELFVRCGFSFEYESKHEYLTNGKTDSIVSFCYYTVEKE